MIRKKGFERMGYTDVGWLQSRHHFAFNSYQDPFNKRFGVVRVVNDDIVHPGLGFETHSHQHMEILTYVLRGQLTHADSHSKVESQINPGEVQYMSAGSGIRHSEHNRSQTEPLHFVQIWVIPDAKDYPLAYGSHAFAMEERFDRWLHVAGSYSSQAPVRLHQDINIYACLFTRSGSQTFTVHSGRQAYVVQAEGVSKLNGLSLQQGEAMETWGQQELTIQAQEQSHILLFEMSQEHLPL